MAVTLVLLVGCSAGTDESFEGAAPGRNHGPDRDSGREDHGRLQHRLPALRILPQRQTERIRYRPHERDREEGRLRGRIRERPLRQYPAGSEHRSLRRCYLGDDHNRRPRAADRLLRSLLQRRPGAPGSERVGSQVHRRPRRGARRRPGRLDGPDRRPKSSWTASR